jgi:1-acyl-sn-glycerol-3-phosphate acyltransferase
MSLRGCGRAVALAYILIGSILRFWLMRVKGPRTLERRAEWLQETSCAVLRSMGIRLGVLGQPAMRGLVVANHLSYLDIVILAAAMPCFFVAKIEIKNWPYFGKAARSGGTLFIDRSSLASASRVAAVIRERLQLLVPVLFFPEGTSTDGSTVLRFHARLFEPAILAAAPITAAAVRYVIEDGTPERELCWYGDGMFFSHLMKALNTPGFSAEVRFGEPRIYPHRRIAADRTHDEIEGMRKVATAMEHVGEVQVV